MHSRRSFFMRGGSVVGAVLVVALLSAAAIAIDSSNLAQKGTQIAQVGGAVQPSTDAKAAKVASGEQSAVCIRGFDFAIYEENNKPIIGCRSATQCTVLDPMGIQPFVKTVGADGKATGTACPVIASKYLNKISSSTSEPARQCHEGMTGKWECRFYHCSAAYKEGCRLMGTAKEGEAIGSKKVIADASTKLTAADFEWLSEKSSSSSFESVSAGESQFSQALLGGSETQVNALKTDLAQTQADLDKKMFEFQECQGNTSFTDSSLCQNQMTAVTAAQQKLSQQQLKLQEMQKYAQQLKGSESVLAPSGGEPAVPDLGNPTATPGFCITSCRPLIVQPNRYDATCLNHPAYPNPPAECRNTTDANPYSTFFQNNTGQPTQLELACRSGNQQACQQLAGGGQQGVYASPGYGARPSGGQQGCNSNSGMGGGIFGTIISLVMRGIGGNNSNGGCNSGNGSDVPTPSCTITATPRTVGKGDAVTLSWQSERGFSAILSSSGSVAPSGSVTVNPQTTTTYSLQVNGYIDNRTGQQLRGECSTQVIVDGEGGGTGSPKAEISCRPEVADVGMQVAVSFACANSSVSAGNGFSTDNQMSGSATPTIENPTIGTTNAIFGVTCSKEGKTDTAQCTVAINKTSMVLIANPKNVESGAQANVGWVTSGMQECTISSPTLSGFTAENAGNTATSGLAKTPALEADAEFELTCTTKSGVVKTAKTIVEVD